jgi:hypothetical protein
MTESGADAEMPRYQCHKQVHALKIAMIEGPGPWKITPEDARYAAFECPPEMFSRFTPMPGDYYVVYDDGYKSFSPAKAFEEGYTRI